MLVHQAPATTLHLPSISVSTTSSLAHLHSPLVVSTPEWQTLSLVQSNQRPPQGSWPELTGRDRLAQDTVLFPFEQNTLSRTNTQLLQPESSSTQSVCHVLSSLMDSEIWVTWTFTYNVHYFSFWFRLNWHLDMKGHPLLRGPPSAGQSQSCWQTRDCSPPINQRPQGPPCCLITTGFMIESNKKDNFLSQSIRYQGNHQTKHSHLTTCCASIGEPPSGIRRREHEEWELLARASNSLS